MSAISEKTVSKQIVYRLKENGITQKELARMIGVSEATVAYYANGKRIPNLNTAYKIAAALNCSIDELSGIKKSYNIQETSDEAAIKTMYSILNKNGKRQMFEYLENVTSNKKNLDVLTDQQLNMIHDILSSLKPNQT